MDIIYKVATWRKLYLGLMTPDEVPGVAPSKTTSKHKKLSLEESATYVGVSKKSLDDYLLQLRFGRKFGFSFVENRD